MVRSGQDGKPAINGGLASIPAVQSGFSLAHATGLGPGALADQQALTQQQVYPLQN